MQLGNGLWETAQYDDERLQITQIGLGTTASTQNLLKLEFKYEGPNPSSTPDKNNGSMREQKITVPTVGSNNGFTATQTYTYDSLNRIDVTEEKIGGTTTWKQDFLYDRYGNRRFDAANTTTLGSCSTSVCNPTFPTDSTNRNRFSSGQNYVYDAAGSVTQNSQGERFTYDAEGHQKEFFVASNSGSTPDATYHYDGEGRRVKKISSTETTVFVYDGSGKLVAEYSTTLASTPQVSYLTTDHLGSPRVVTNENGVVTDRKDFTAFGEAVASSQRISGLGYSTTAQEPRKDFTGYEKDTESGLEFAQARYYNRTHGRFTSVDPLTASAAIKNPQTFNRYSYVLNSPYKFTDPLGLLPGGCGADRSNCDGDPGVGSANIYGALANHNQRLRNTHVQLAAQAAANRGDTDAMWDLIRNSGNKDDFEVSDKDGNIVKDPHAATGTATAPNTQQQGGATSAATQGAAKQAYDQAVLTNYLKDSVVGRFINFATLKFGVDGNGKVVAFFEFTNPGRAAEVLKAAKDQFINAKLGGAHVKELGESSSKNVFDFRSYTIGANRLGNMSLQVNIGKTSGRARADLDRFNPAQDVVGGFGHFFLELLPNIFR